MLVPFATGIGLCYLNQFGDVVFAVNLGSSDRGGRVRAIYRAVGEIASSFSFSWKFCMVLAVQQRAYHGSWFAPASSIAQRSKCIMG